VPHTPRVVAVTGGLAYAQAIPLKGGTVRKAFIGSVVAVAMAVSVRAKPAAAGTDNRCYGQIAAGIAATWPWAHDNKSDFPPPPGALALWIREFGPDVGVSSVRELQLLFCTPI